MATIHRLAHPAHFTLLASAARTATVTGDAQYNNEALGILLFIDVTAAAATPSVVPKIQAGFPDTTAPTPTITWVDYFTVAAALTATGDYTYLLYPAILASADGNMTESVNLPLPRVWRLVLTHADTDSFTYSVTGQYL